MKPVKDSFLNQTLYVNQVLMRRYVKALALQDLPIYPHFNKCFVTNSLYILI